MGRRVAKGAPQRGIAVASRVAVRNANGQSKFPFRRHHGRRGTFGAVLGVAALWIVAGTPAHGQPSQAERHSASVEHFLAQAPKGTLRVQAVQGSGGGTSLAGAAIEVDLYQERHLLRQIKAVLDERGQVLLTDIPIILGVVPVVQIQHDGVTYQEPGELMDPENREISIEVKVFDTTEEMPEWRIAMRHVLVKGSAGGTGAVGGVLSVSEMVVVESLGDRTWLGGALDERNKRSTVQLDLPRGSRKVQLESGFHGWCCTKYSDPALSVQMPLMPGRTTFQFSYEVATASGSTGDTRLIFSAPAAVEHLMIFVPEVGFEVATTGEELVEVPGVGTSGRLLQGQGFAAGATAGVVLTSQRSAVAMAAKPEFPRWAIWGGLLLVGALAVLWLVRRKGSGVAARSSVP
jgi:hypothetical protein